MSQEQKQLTGHTPVMGQHILIPNHEVMHFSQFQTTRSLHATQSSLYVRTYILYLSIYVTHLH